MTLRRSRSCADDHHSDRWRRLQLSPIAIAMRPHAANRSHGNCARDVLESDSARTIGDLVVSMTASPASPDLWSMLTDALLELEPSGSKRPVDAQANPAAAAAMAANTSARRPTHISRDRSGDRTRTTRSLPRPRSAWSSPRDPPIDFTHRPASAASTEREPRIPASSQPSGRQGHTSRSGVPEPAPPSEQTTMVERSSPPKPGTRAFHALKHARQNGRSAPDICAPNARTERRSDERRHARPFGIYAFVAFAARIAGYGRLGSRDRAVVMCAGGRPVCPSAGMAMSSARSGRDFRFPPEATFVAALRPLIRRRWRRWRCSGSGCSRRADRD